MPFQYLSIHFNILFVRTIDVDPTKDRASIFYTQRCSFGYALLEALFGRFLSNNSWMCFGISVPKQQRVLPIWQNPLLFCFML